MNIIGLKKNLSGEDLKRLEYIVTHVKNIFKKDSGHKFFLPHDPEHFARVEKKANELISGKEKELSPKESFLLLSGIWLHDIGMIRKNEQESALAVRKNHHTRSREYINNNYHVLGLSKTESWTIGELVEYHRKCMDIYDLGKEDCGTIRTRLLGAILRLADGLDVNYQRAQEPLYRLYIGFNMPRENWIHWIKHLLTIGTKCDEINNRIIVYIALGKNMDQEKYRPLIELVEEEIRDELNSVKEVISASNFIRYNIVEKKIEFKHLTREQENELREGLDWIAMREAVTASQVIETIQGAINWIVNSSDQITEIKQFTSHLVNEALRLRQRNFAIHNIKAKICEIFRDKKNLKSNLNNFLKELDKKHRNAPYKIAEFGKEIIKERDRLLLFGMSKTLIHVLEKCPYKKSIKVYVAECRNKSKKGYNEGISFAEIVKEIGFKKVCFLSDISIGHYMEKTKGEITKVLGGADGICSDGSIISTIGYKTLGAIAKSMEIPFYIFVETLKISNVKTYEDDVRPAEDLIQDPDLLRRLEDSDIEILNESTDKIEGEYITSIVTECGIFLPSKIKNLI